MSTRELKINWKKQRQRASDELSLESQFRFNRYWWVSVLLSQILHHCIIICHILFSNSTDFALKLFLKRAFSRKKGKIDTVDNFSNVRWWKLFFQQIELNVDCPTVRMFCLKHLAINNCGSRWFPSNPGNLREKASILSTTPRPLGQNDDT